MNRLRFGFEVSAAAAPGLAAFLERFGAEAVSLSGASSEPLFVEGATRGADALWTRTCVEALFPADVDTDILLACVRNHLGVDSAFKYEVGPVADRDWNTTMPDGSGPIVFGTRLCICPGWCDPEPADHVLHLDPGLAFGSGRHATTWLCLEWLTRAQLDDAIVIDYGCGSGILGIAAGLMGARAVYAVDVDEQALAATRTNAGRNGVLERMHIVAPDSLPSVGAHVTIANILLNPLLELAPRLAGLTARGGALGLSGLLANQAGTALAAYGRWFSMDPAKYREEWALLTGRRTGTMPPAEY